jgi:AGZA family xanthine/uracil permease-like MFS transporter
MIVRNVRGALLIAMIVIAAIGMVFGLVALPNGIMSFNIPSMRPLIFQAFLVPTNEIFSINMIIVVFTFMFVDLFDTVGCFVGLGAKANMIDENGNIENATKGLLADAVGTTVGAVLGTSAVTTYVESAAGIAEGGRTGLTAVVTAGLFLVSLLFAPIFSAIPVEATSPVLVIVGVMMATSLAEIDWLDFTNAIPAFLTVVMMPFGYSIADGIMFGIISFTLIKLATGKKKDINIGLIILTVLFIIKFVWLG